MHFLDGIFFVPLAAIRDADLVPAAIAATLDVGEAGLRSLSDSIAAAVGDRRLLLVLDNFEQVLDAAALVSDLLVACPRLSVMITSRVVLHLSGEHIVAVEPLALASAELLPALEQLNEIASVRLFVERARASRSDFRLTAANAASIAAICARLEGVPLAIELASARVRLLAPNALLANLEQRLHWLAGGPRDQSARQRTMRATIAWSYDLLGSDQQRLFRCLAVFAGGWTLETAKAVCGADLDVLEELGILVDHSLVQQLEQADGSSRFAMLDMIRDFALEQLAANDEELAVRAPHAATFLRLADEGHPELGEIEESGDRHYHSHLTRPGTVDYAVDAWLERMELERDNLRAALIWFLDTNEAESALRLATALGMFWEWKGYLSEGIAWLELALSLSSETPGHLRASARCNAGLLRIYQGNFTAGQNHFEESKRLWDALGDEYGALDAIAGFASVAEYRGDVAGATRLYEEILARGRGHFDALVAFALANLSYTAYWQGDLERAAALAEEALAAGPLRPLLHYLVLLSVAQVAIERGEHGRAMRLYTEVVSGDLNPKPPMSIAGALAGFAGVAAATGQPRPAARLLGAVAAIMERHGLVVLPFNIQHERALAAAHAALTPAAYEQSWTGGRGLTLDAAVAEALAMGTTAQAPAALGHGLTPREAQVLRLIAEGLSDREIGVRLYISPHTVMRHVANILSKLGVSSRTAAAAWAVRQDLT